MYSVKWIDLETKQIQKKKFENYENKLHFIGKILFIQELEGKIVRLNWKIGLTSSSLDGIIRHREKNK